MREGGSKGGGERVKERVSVRTREGGSKGGN